MKPYQTILAGLLLLTSTAAGQSVRVTFSATDRHTAAFVQLDSVRIENLFTMRDTVIKAPFVIDFDIGTGISDRSPDLVQFLEISGNFANPFTDATNLSVTTATRGLVQLELNSISGRREADLNAVLEAGTHQFSLKAASLPAGVYLLTARAGQSSRSVRIVKSGASGGGSPMLVHDGQSASLDAGGFRKAAAALYRFTGYADTYHPEAVTAAPAQDTAIVFAMRRVEIAPVIDRFVCLNPVLYAGDTAVFEVEASSALKSLKLICIDFEKDDMMDDSVNVSGASTQTAFRRTYAAAGRYNARACVYDLYGNKFCKDLDSAVTVLDPLPVLTTSPVTEIRPTTARSGGSISSEGACPVTARGVCWSASPAPTTADGKTSDGTGTGNFTSSITGLAEKTTHFIRAYATNSAGTAYGNELSFKTADPNDNLPVLRTESVSGITATTARSGGNISSDGGYPVTARGVCWSTSPAPTTADGKTSDGTGKGSFTSRITGLAAKTKYYVRAYAVNSKGAGYGDELSFKTQQDYVTIGTQVWMLKNLDVDRYRNGDRIPQVTDPQQWANLSTGAWCYNNNDPAMGAIYGKLYNWYAVNDARGLAPAGWHVPTDAEWTVLTTYLGGESVAGGKLKEAGTAHWIAPNTGATNSSGFTALPAGVRGADGTFSSVGDYGNWWSSSAGSSPWGVWYRGLGYSYDGVGRHNASRNHGFSVRCVRD